MEKPYFHQWNSLLLVTLDFKATSQYKQLILAALDFFFFQF